MPPILLFFLPGLGIRLGCNWSVACYSVSDWKKTAHAMKGTDSRRERALVQLITENFLPNLPKIVEDMVSGFSWIAATVRNRKILLSRNGKSYQSCSRNLVEPQIDFWQENCAKLSRKRFVCLLRGTRPVYRSKRFSVWDAFSGEEMRAWASRESTKGERRERENPWRRDNDSYEEWFWQDAPTRTRTKVERYCFSVTSRYEFKQRESS